MNENLKTLRPLLVLFIVVNCIPLIFKSFLQQHGFDNEFLLVANLLLFILSFSGFMLQIKGLKSPNGNVFIRGVYASLLVKIFVVIIVLFIYLFVTKGKVNKPSIFASMALYILYTFIEVKRLLKISGRKPNA